MRIKKLVALLLIIAAAVGAVVYCVIAGGAAEKQNSEASAYVITADDLVNGVKEITLTDSVEITAGGKYILSGEIADGQIHVKVSGKENVVLVLSGVSITNTSGPAIYVEKAGNTCIYLAEGTENIIVSGTETEITSSNIVEAASGGAILLKDDATICGSGSLTVMGYINNGIHASDSLFIEDGKITVTSLNDGIKGNDSITVEGGDITVNSAGDAMHSDGSVYINGGLFELSTEDDGIHADGEVLIKGGTLTVTSSYEGIEGETITVDDGLVYVTARDDGFNASGTNPVLTINGGTVYVNASGDGLDSNYDLVITGGYVVVDGPSNNGNGALDSGSESGGKITVSGGTLLAIGASGMAETPDSDSTQGFGSVSASFSGGDKIQVCDSDGNVIIDYTSKKSGDSIIFSFEGLAIGDSCTVNVNDTAYEVEITNESSGGFGGFGGGGFPGGNGGGFPSRPSNS